jgi:hypothetical protein
MLTTSGCQTSGRYALLAALLFAVLPVIGMAQSEEEISVDMAPPPLPVYELPPVPGDGYLWAPGYWAWSDDDQDFYWVPGTWVLAPQPLFLWTPGYWGFAGGVFLWHVGYWGPRVGFYGGIDYGCGYGGLGFQGGYWQGGRFVHNRAVFGNLSVNRVSYNGGTGGVRAAPSEAESAAALDRRLAPTAAQRQQAQLARGNPALRAGVNHGIPPIAATARPGAFTGADVVAAKHAGTMSVVHMGAPPGTAPPGAIPGHTAPEHTAPEHTAPERAAPERAAPGRPAPEGTAAAPAEPAPPNPKIIPARPTAARPHEAAEPPQPKPAPTKPVPHPAEHTP